LFVFNELSHVPFGRQCRVERAQKTPKFRVFLDGVAAHSKPSGEEKEAGDRGAWRLGTGQILRDFCLFAMLARLSVARLGIGCKDVVGVDVCQGGMGKTAPAGVPAPLEARAKKNAAAEAAASMVISLLRGFRRRTCRKSEAAARQSGRCS
jgi:hypothetical protein